MLLHLFYVARSCCTSLVGWLIVLIELMDSPMRRRGTPSPIVFKKESCSAPCLFEVIGLGCGFGPLNNR